MSIDTPCNIYSASIWKKECKIEEWFKIYCDIWKFTKNSCVCLQKSSELLSIPRNLFEIAGKF